MNADCFPIRLIRDWLFLLSLAGCLCASAQAASAKAGAKRAELQGLQGRIQALQNELGQAEESRADVAEELRDTEQTISDANRKLRELGSERDEVQTSLNDLNTQSQRLAQRVAAQQAQLGKLLYRQYRHGESDALKHLLSGNDPNQRSRDAHYLALLSRAKAGLIQELGATLEEKQRLAEQAGAKVAELAQIEKSRQSERATLLEQQKKRQVVLTRIAGQIKSQRREIDKLKRDERRLTKLIEGLSRLAAKPKTRRAAPRQEQTAQAIRNEQTPDDSTPSGVFAQQRGRLRLPTRGEIVNKFGSPRPEGGASWKGLFIRAATGGEVKAIAPGQIVFADWLRGFGNLVIVDHGDGYLSVYGNNESLFKEVGQSAKAGETIAAVGNSGGNPETGLYFELRHLGQPLDPLKWVSLK